MSHAALATISAGETSTDRDQLISPSHGEWDTVPATIVHLAPTPLESQPSVYVRKTWEQKAHGAVSEVTVQAVSAGGALLIRLGWSVASPRGRVSDNDIYADACGVLFPADGRSADLSSMGSPASPVAAWYWRAGLDAAMSVTATGVGTVERDSTPEVRAVGELRGNEWHVVFSRVLNGGAPKFIQGSDVPVGFAIWCGANDERAGLKSHTTSWHRLAVN